MSNSLILALFAILAFSACQPNQTGIVRPALQPDNTWLFTVGSTRLQVNPAHGARIVSYKYEGIEILHTEPTEGYEDMVGSTCWISPQALWGWPPPFDADQGKYNATLDGDKLVLTGPLVTTGGNVPFPFQIVKTLWGNSGESSITIHYQIYNRDTIARSFSAWEVMRVPPSGLTFFPTDGPVFGDMAPAFELVDGIAWWDFDNKYDHVKKAYADGKSGWMAHVTKDRVLHIKQFEDTPSNFPEDEKGTPLQMEMEFWANEQKNYLELEKQGKYKEILPGEYAELTMRWYLRELPESMDIELGSVMLLDFVQTVLGN